ncbi:MAG: hypothetical protein MI867_26835 [Pseudomonadales bacterium]|nr:hypothetical protein [Pseudomonadales bacterium]
MKTLTAAQKQNPQLATGLLIGLLAFSGIANAEETQDQKKPAFEETTGTTIIGTKEAPNVLNVVPWQGRELNADPWDIRPSPAQSVLEESLQPIDRDVLRREIEYFNLIQGSE